MNQGEARIVAYSEKGLNMCAAAARISTFEGCAFKALSRGDGGEKDIKLIGKVLSSGHKTIIEHQMFTIAFNDVSVLAEQSLIEFRLASYTVKSRRYVNFSGAGYIIPAGLSGAAEEEFRRNMDGKFEAYKKLLDLGISREDARFVLPYCFRSNFFMTLNARELAHVIAAMRYGRLKRYPELVRLGEMLNQQMNEILPGTADIEKPAFSRVNTDDSEGTLEMPHRAVTEAALFGAPSDAEGILNAALDATNRFTGDDKLKKLVKDARPRELELLNYAFMIKNVSLSCVTHFARHRMQSLIVPDVERALFKGAYVLPKTIMENAEALIIYENAFRENYESACRIRSMGVGNDVLAYYALSGNTVDILLSMNARELLHFLKLRTCTRAQWEIRESANEMLMLLMEDFSALFKYFGPSCAVNGFCPEGRLSCGRIQKTGE
ncbi:MAG: FAD-dependent thymidylate synthase [Clostridia bacterium]|nr:FAD-dependent thymidylate synthase [Clostridia bacterium]